MNDDDVLRELKQRRKDEGIFFGELFGGKDKKETIAALLNLAFLIKSDQVEIEGGWIYLAEKGGRINSTDIRISFPCDHTEDDEDACGGADPNFMNMED